MSERYPNDERTHELAILMDLLFEAQLRGRDNDCPWCDANLHYKDSNHNKDYCPYMKYADDLLNFGKARPW